MNSVAADNAPDRGPATRYRCVVDALKIWFDTSTHTQRSEADLDRVDWLRILPFIGLHLACLGVIWVGFSWFALWTAATIYLVRMFAITGFYHRYFSHKSFKTSRATQFVFALLGASCVQRGPLWWAAHHRNHHRHADTALDVHSPVTRSFIVSHMGWFLTPRGFPTDHAVIKDLEKFPELRWLDRYDLLIPIFLAVGLFALGALLETHAPGLGTNGWQLLVWGFFISTIALFHVSVTINSIAHVWGTRRYPTRDNSRNNWLLAILTMGEGWHNNHHHYPGSARQGFRWWEIDMTYYGLRALAALGLIWDLRPVPARILAARPLTGPAN